MKLDDLLTDGLCLGGVLLLGIAIWLVAGTPGVVAGAGVLCLGLGLWRIG